MIYPDTWQAFAQMQYTTGAMRRNYPEWHKGRQRYHVWAIDIDNTLVNQRLHQYRELLGDSLVQPYQRQPHVTLAACGFVNAIPMHNDDVSPAVIETQMCMLQGLQLSPFEIRIGGINSFASAPFLEVGDASNTLATIRHALAGERGDFRTAAYVPHITVGIYNDRHQVTNIIDRMGGNSLQAISIMVNAINLYSYNASDIGSSLMEEWRMSLNR